MKKLINRPEDVVREMIEGLLALYPTLKRVRGHNVVFRSDAASIRDTQVALISGGGSGHEPAHAGFVGDGMLSAAVAGEVFTSPTTDSVLAAIRAVTGKAGALLIVKNYTGDRLNFGLAAERARAEGLNVDHVVVADDVALAQEKETAGARGLAGTILVHKIAGAAAAEGKSLAEVKAIGDEVIKNVGTMSVSLSAGTSPSSGRQSFTLSDDEVELGLGIHGEPGVSRARLLPADDLAKKLVVPILEATNIVPGDPIIALINNLGTTTVMEQAIVARGVLRYLQSSNLKVERLYAGTFMSSLDMAGVSVSLLRIDHRLLAWLDAPTSAPAWPNVARERPGDFHEIATLAPEGAARRPVPTRTPGRFDRTILACCNALLAARDKLTELDRITGDGDLGVNMASVAEAIRRDLPSYPEDLAGSLQTLATTIQNGLGGSSGPLYAAFFLRASGTLAKSRENDPTSWAAAALDGCEAVSELGNARPGDRTMLDALVPFCTTLHDQLQSGASLSRSLQRAAQAADEGAQATARLKARRGRASYLGDRVLGHPDPGAVAAAIWLRAAVESLSA